MSGHSLPPRFWAKVDKTPTCWNWTGATSHKGYGRSSIGHTNIQAHRMSYEAAKGPIPAGLQIDHLCRNRRCVNPDHLEAVTPYENQHRGTTNATKTHCPQGHAYEPANTRITKRGRRQCRQCARDQTHRRRHQ